MLRQPAPPAHRRGWLREQCRRRGDDERDLWQALVRYRQTGSAGLLNGTWRRPTAFGRQDALLRERLLTLLLDTPPCMLEEFELLAPLLQELADRLSFLCSWVLELFLDPDTLRELLKYTPIAAIRQRMHLLPHAGHVLAGDLHLHRPPRRSLRAPHLDLRR